MINSQIKADIFNGHVDTVAHGPLELRNIAEPYSGRVIDKKIYVHGASDMKGRIAATIIALRA